MVSTILCYHLKIKAIDTKNSNYKPEHPNQSSNFKYFDAAIHIRFWGIRKRGGEKKRDG